MTKFILAAAALLSATALADDRVKEVQAELKNQGFFYGTVDGKEGPETTAALRRFEIRNGLPVTGAINAQTLEVLGLDGKAPEPAKTPPGAFKSPQAAPPPPAQTAPPNPPVPPKATDQLNPPPPGEAPTATKPRDLVRNPAPPPMPSPRPAVPDSAPVSSRPRPGNPDDLAVVPPPRGIPPAVQDDFSTFYHSTPYASAPREVQISVLRAAQDRLARDRYYRGMVDGLPGPATSEALFLYQEQRRLNRTGRLDLQTLADLSLLPGRDPEAPPLKPFYNPNRRRDRSVDRPE